MEYGLTQSQQVVIAGLVLFLNIFYAVIIGVMVATNWKIFTKAGQKGWKIFIPIYNIIIMLRIINRPWWWILLLFIPVVNIAILFITMFDLAKVFNRSAAYGMGIIFMPIIFLPIIAFGSSEYKNTSTQQISSNNSDLRSTNNQISL